MLAFTGLRELLELRPFLFPILQQKLLLNHLHYDHMVGYAIPQHSSLVADNYSNTGNRSE